jgi:hypothetical protein
LREQRFAIVAREFSTIISTHYADFSQPDSDLDDGLARTPSASAPG